MPPAVIVEIVKADAEALEEIVANVRLNRVKNRRFDFDLFAMTKQWENHGNPITFFEPCWGFKEKAEHTEAENVREGEFIVLNTIHARKFQAEAQVLAWVFLYVALDEGE